MDQGGGQVISKSSRWSLIALFKSKKRHAQMSSSGDPYHAVSIVRGQNACDAARRFGGHRFLAQHAPPLPLPACDAASCTCRFRHHEDRRTRTRRNDFGLRRGLWNGDDRRRSPGRRLEDREQVDWQL
jgi:hypothetical protein